jgi:phosphomannomutase
MIRPMREELTRIGVEELRTPEDVQKTIAAVKDRLSEKGEEDFTDGYSLTTDDWRFNIRGSNTEPLLRLNIEARKPGLVEKIRAEIEPIIGSKPH